ncbi:MbnP family protein [Dyadobacter sp. 3J3]|uniref:MbnP family protein n=1 Tax=Dyadobacter sp. 3J3 TaxID=2606600 RepID=UPI00135BE3B9|nr:MbnP family protein [Dyadobacter sp. 3J3]
MKKLIYLSLLSFICAVSIVACNDDSNDVTDNPDLVAGTGKLTLKFDNVSGTQDLKLDSTKYTNSSGEDFTVSTLNYFISNIKLVRDDGKTYTIPQDSSYFLIRESDPKSQIVTLKQLPEGNYTGVEYIIGVDSLRSVSGIDKRVGALDPSGDPEDGGMYWAWSSGYIFLKLEGVSAKAGSANNKFYYHIGFFGGYDSKTVNNIKTVKLDFGGNKAIVSSENVPQVRLIGDVQKVFNGPVPISIAKNPSIMFDFTLSSNAANNYKSMFSFGEITPNISAQ